jgi:hypothetical protein
LNDEEGLSNPLEMADIIDWETLVEQRDERAAAQPKARD